MGKDVEKLMGLPLEKALCIGEAYAHLLNALAPEHGNASTLDTKDPTERANLILEHAERMDCKRYVTSKDIVVGSTNLNLAFVAQIFQQSGGMAYPWTPKICLLLR
ncbi:unnamed protein product [Camellia sinensis]